MPGDDAVRDLVVFEFDGSTFAVEASRVDSVIAWREPVSLPRAGTAVLGALQDRGRIVTVLRHPSGGTTSRPLQQLTRMIVCTTQRGHIGLPASRTRTIGPVELKGDLAPGRVVDSSAGALTYIDPEALARLLGESGPAAG